MKITNLLHRWISKWRENRFISRVAKTVKPISLDDDGLDLRPKLAGVIDLTKEDREASRRCLDAVGDVGSEPQKMNGLKLPRSPGKCAIPSGISVRRMRKLPKGHILYAKPGILSVQPGLGLCVESECTFPLEPSRIP